MGRALVFDCDGVLADTERYGHLPAFNATFAEVGADLRWTEEDYARYVRIGGGKERMAAALTPEVARRQGLPEDEAGRRALLAGWHARKSGHYQAMVRDGVMPPRPGVRDLAAAALDAGWQVAVASTSAADSVRAVLDHVVGEALSARIPVFAGDVVAAKKPAPDIYRLALTELGVDPADAVAVEDSENGLRAAVGARIATVVTVSSYTAEEDFTGAAVVLSDLGAADAPLRVLADPWGVHPSGRITVADLERVLALR